MGRSDRNVGREAKYCRFRGLCQDSIHLRFQLSMCLFWTKIRSSPILQKLFRPFTLLRRSLVIIFSRPPVIWFTRYRSYKTEAHDFTVYHQNFMTMANKRRRVPLLIEFQERGDLQQAPGVHSIAIWGEALAYSTCKMFARPVGGGARAATRAD